MMSSSTDPPPNTKHGGYQRAPPELQGLKTAPPSLSGRKLDDVIRYMHRCVVVRGYENIIKQCWGSEDTEGKGNVLPVSAHLHHHHMADTSVQHQVVKPLPGNIL